MEIRPLSSRVEKYFTRSLQNSKTNVLYPRDHVLSSIYLTTCGHRKLRRERCTDNQSHFSWHSPLRGGEGTPLFNVHVKEILQKLSLVKCLYQCSQLHPVRTPQYSSSSSIQEAMNHVESWAGQNKMALNAKEISISFKFKILLSLTPRIQLSVNI